MKVDHSKAYAFSLQLLGGIFCRRHRNAAGEDGSVVALVKGDSLPDLIVISWLIDKRLSAAADPDIDRPGIVNTGPDRLGVSVASAGAITVILASDRIIARSSVAW